MRTPKVYWRSLRREWNRNGWEPTDTGWVLTISIIWIVSWLAYPIREGQTQSKLDIFLDQQPSAMGDTLAGIFSALAFVWIIVTVFMQASELSAQREELTLMRKEYAGQREATQAMAEVLRDEQEVRKRTTYSRVFASLTGAIESEIRYIWKYCVELEIQSDADSQEIHKHDFFTEPTGIMEERRVFEEFIDQLFHLVIYLKKIDTKGRVSKRFSTEQNFERIKALVDEIDEVWDQFGAETKAQYSSLRLDMMRLFVVNVLAADVWQTTDDIDKLKKKFWS